MNSPSPIDRNFNGSYPASTDLTEQLPPPRNFGAYSEDRRRQIFEEDTPHTPGYNNYAAGGMAEPPQHRPFEGSIETKPYDETIFVLHWGKRGIRISIQATTKTFLLILLIAIIVLSRPGLADIVGSMVNNILGGH